MYAVPVSWRDGSTLPTVPHGGRFGMFFVTLVHVFPASRVTCTSPSLVPTQMTPACFGDSAIAWMTLPYSTPPIECHMPRGMPLPPPPPPRPPPSPSRLLLGPRYDGPSCLFVYR